MMKVIQGAGRVFRTLDDKGIVMLIGERFLNPYYNQILPHNWKVEYPENLESRIQSFWECQ
jgi:Rad3-related DNA helicase